MLFNTNVGRYQYYQNNYIIKVYLLPRNGIEFMINKQVLFTGLHP